MRMFLGWVCLMIIGGVMVLLAGSCAPDAWIREPAPYEIVRVRRANQRTWYTDRGYFIQVAHCESAPPFEGWAFITEDWKVVFDDRQAEPGARCRVEVLGPVVAQP